MGLGDEIMALGRAETLYEETGRQVSIINHLGGVRTQPIWHGNPAWNPRSSLKLLDDTTSRAYIKHWHGKQIIFNTDHTPRAGRIYFDDSYRDRCPLEPPYAIIEPNIKKMASVNKNWGRRRWAKVIKNFPVPVYQLVQDRHEIVVEGAIAHQTPDIYDALAAIERAALVMCNEGGTHHMAASMGTPAVVIFGSFIPPQVTGYEIHENIAVETNHGYCGKWDKCEECTQALSQIKPADVREKAILIMES